MDFIDVCLDICLIILMVGLIVLLGVEIVLLIVRAISTYKENKKEIVEEKKKESYLIHMTFTELELRRSYKNLIYVKATSSEEALKRAEEYYIEHCQIPTLKTWYEEGRIAVIARCIDDCAIIW